MGAYLSEPVTEKISNDDETDRVRYGVSSMQGWRISQEDAHNCVIDFDKNSSLFAVYDGHGGHEVAVYCSQKLPAFIKNTEAYKNADFGNALIDAFLGFDASTATKDVIAVLKDIGGVKDSDSTAEDSSEDDEENVNNLYEEASMPIEQVMEKYQSNILSAQLSKQQEEPVSSVLKSLKSYGECSGSSTTSISKSGACSSNIPVDSISSDNFTIKKDDVNEASISSSADLDVSCGNSKSTNNGETAETYSTNIKTEENPLKLEEPSLPSVAKAINSSTDETEATVTDVKNDESVSIVDEKAVSNGKTSEVNINDESSENVPQTNGKFLLKKGKGKAIIKSIISEAQAPANIKNFRARNAKQLYNKLLEMEDESDSEEDDDTFEEAPSYNSSDSSGDESSEVCDEGEEENDEDLFDEEDDNEFTRNMREEPGSDSGCTAVVALIHENELYVANAGDSRCVVCRNGEAVDMSFDHKPEDKPEMDRIVNAGGKVTQDGRVNGGLNLSRAIGDHAYKQNTDLTDKEQMITALPDIKTITIKPTEDEFMVLACDGIWNFMSSQEVVDFVRTRLNKETGPEKLSHICEELFDHCLAPHTMGDGTGCDNMTSVIVQFRNGLLKRSASPTSMEQNEQDKSLKRAKTDAASVK